MDVSYQLESYPELDVDEFIDVLVRSTLAERRPVDEPETIRGMLEHADIIVTARSGGLLVGISRAITDYNFCTYLSDLAVDVDYQNRGIGKELIRRTHESAGQHTTLILLAAPRARDVLPSCRNAAPRLLLDHSSGARQGFCSPRLNARRIECRRGSRHRSTQETIDSALVTVTFTRHNQRGRRIHAWHIGLSFDSASRKTRCFMPPMKSVWFVLGSCNAVHPVARP